MNPAPTNHFDLMIAIIEKKGSVLSPEQIAQYYNTLMNTIRQNH